MNILCGMPGAIARRNRVSHNLLTSNQATGTDTLGDTTGFVQAAGATLSSSTDQVYQGSNSLKVVTTAALSNEGMGCNKTTTTPGLSDAATVFVYAPLGATLALYHLNSDWSTAGSTSFTGTGAWQKVTNTATPKAGSTGSYIQIFTVTTKQAITFYADALKLQRIIP